MNIEVKFPKPERMAKGRNGFMEIGGVWMFDSYNVVELYPMTAKGDHSEVARLVVPFSHLRDFRDALNDMLTHVMEVEGQRLAFARGDVSILDLLVEEDATTTEKPYANVKIDSLTEALCRMVYETTHLSPQRDDGSHDCRISNAALTAAREALKL